MPSEPVVAAVVGHRELDRYPRARRAHSDDAYVVGLPHRHLDSFAVPAASPVGQRGHGLRAVNRARPVRRMSDLVCEMVPAFLAAVGDEARVRAVRHRAAQATGDATIAHLLVDATVREEEELAGFAVASPDLASVTCIDEEVAMPLVDRGSSPIEHLAGAAHRDPLQTD